MPKANDTSIYSYDEIPSLLDYLFGSDINNNKKNRSYKIKSIIELLNSVNGKNAIQYQFSDGTNPEIDYLTPGALFTNNNEIAVGDFTQLIFNKDTVRPIDVSPLFSKLGQLENVVLKLENPEDPNNFFNFKVVSFEDLEDCFAFGVQDFNGLYLGELINEKFYSFYFDIKSTTNEDDKFTSVGTISLVDNEITISIGFEWEINAGEFANLVPYIETIPYSSTGNQRFVLFVANVFDTFEMISGPESASNPVVPPVPNNTLQVTLLLVTDGEISEPTIPITGDEFVKKMESQDFIVDYGATTVIEQINLTDDRSSISLTNAVTDIKSIQVSGEFLRPGKPHFVKNRTNHDVTIWHDAGTGNVKYFFPNELDLVVKPNEVIEFNLNGNDSSDYQFEFVGLITDLSDYYNKTETDGLLSAIVSSYTVIAKNFVNSSPVTGTIIDTTVESFVIPANTFQVGDCVVFKCRTNKTGTNGGILHRHKIGLAAIFFTQTNTATSLMTQISRMMIIKSATDSEEIDNTANISPYSSEGQFPRKLTYNIDWTVAQTLDIVIRLSNALDSVVVSYWELSRIR